MSENVDKCKKKEMPPQKNKIKIKNSKANEMSHTNQIIIHSVVYWGSLEKWDLKFVEFKENKLPYMFI